MRDKAIARLKSSHYGSDAIMIERLRTIPLTINYRSRVQGGSCKWKRMTYTRQAVDISIEIGYEFATRAPEQEVENCVSHELAHALHVLLTNDSDHGPVWQGIHRAMGGTAERCHTVQVRKNIVQRIKILDNMSGKTYIVSKRKWNSLKEYVRNGSPRFTIQETFTRGGEPQLATA